MNILHFQLMLAILQDVVQAIKNV